MAQEKILGNQINLADLNPLLTTDLVTDTSPQLGGNLDVNSFNLITPDNPTGTATTITINAGKTDGDNRFAGGGIAINGGGSTVLDGGGGSVNIAGGLSDLGSAGNAFLSGGNSINANAGSVGILGGSGALYAGNATVVAGTSTGIGIAAGNVVLRGGTATHVGSPILGGRGGNVSIYPGRGETINGTIDIHHPLDSVSSPEGQGILRIVNDSVPGSPAAVVGVGLTVPASITSDIVFTLPALDGVSGDVLKTDGLGGLTFGAGGGNNWLIANDGNDFTTAPTAAAGVQGGIALGNAANAFGSNSIAIGSGSSTFIAGSPAPVGSAIAIGDGASATADYGLAIGSSATATASYTTSVGASTNTGHGYSVSVGGYCRSYAASQINVGYGVYGDTTVGRCTFGNGLGAAPGGSAGQNLISIVNDGQAELYGDSAMFIMPPYIVASLPTVVEGGQIYVTDATTGPGSPAQTGVQCFGRAGSPPQWIDVITGLAVV